MNGADYYELIGIPSSASPEEIHKSYVKKLQKLHPDRDPGPEAKKQIDALNEAYGVLSDPSKRKLFDECGSRVEALFKVLSSCSINDTVPEATEVLPGFLYLGSRRSGRNIEEIKALRIERVLDVAESADEGKKFFAQNMPSIKYRGISAEDFDSYDISKHFSDACQYIDEAKDAGERILVHCEKGVSRSPTFVLAYLMQNQHWTLEHSTEYLLSKRNICPKRGFFAQLLKFEEELISRGDLPRSAVTEVAAEAAVIRENALESTSILLPDS